MFGKVISAALLAGIALPLAAPGAAADDGVRRPKVPFSGIIVVQRPGKQPARIRIYYGTTHVRMDVSFLKRQLVTIVDKMRRETVLLLPHRREYLRVPSSARGRRAIDNLVAVRGGLKPVGPEKIRGIPVTKYALKTRTASGTTFDGHVWLTADDIMIQTVGKTARGPVHMSLYNLRRGAISPALFVVPSGYVERKPGAKKPGVQKK